MESSVLNNALSFVVALVILAAFTAVFTIALYYLLVRNQENKTDAITVKREDRDLAGVPFFIKRSRWIQETAYLETLLNCTLSATEIRFDAEGKQLSIDTRFSISKISPWSSSVAEKLLSIHKDLVLVQRELDSNKQWETWIEEILPAFQSLPTYAGQIPQELPMISNISQEEVYVDYETEHYINYPQPLIGSANVSVELSQDGTLGKASAEIKDDTLGTLLATIPIKEVVSSTLAAKESTPSKEEAEEGVMGIEEDQLISETIYKFGLTCMQSYIKHIRFNRVTDQGVLAPISLLDNSSWYRQEFVATLEPVVKGSDKVDKNNDKNQ